MEIKIDRSCKKCHPNALNQIINVIQSAWDCVEKDIFCSEFLGYGDPEFVAVDALFYWDGSDTEYAKIQDFLDRSEYDFVGIILYPGFYLSESNMLGEGFCYPFSIPDPAYRWQSHVLNFLIFDKR